MAERLEKVPPGGPKLPPRMLPGDRKRCPFQPRISRTDLQEHNGFAEQDVGHVNTAGLKWGRGAQPTKPEKEAD